MDELEISGRRYISSARAAKEHKYHADYIGQLVRAKKVAGQKVGRAWYVDADSLAEYLGKEVPARGPIAKLKNPSSIVSPEERPLQSTGSATDLPPEPSRDLDLVKSMGSGEKPVAEQEQETKQEFLIPLRKSGRAHVIAAIESEPVKRNIQERKSQPIVEEVIEEKIEEPEIFTTEIIQESAAEEETFIPLKISKEKESVRDIYAEPEDSFYKVSRKGLRYLPQRVAQESYREEKITVTPRAVKGEKKSAGKALRALSAVLVAGILSLGAGVLMSYYLHSSTTVEGAGQTSSVILSN